MLHGWQLNFACDWVDGCIGGKLRPRSCFVVASDHSQCKMPALCGVHLYLCVWKGPMDVTHQTDEDEDELDDVCVGHRVEPPQQCVDDGHH